MIGHKTWHFGDRPEQANAAKLGANFMIASAIEAMGEGASLVEGYDVSGRSFLEMITSTLFLGPVHAGYASVLKDNAIAHGPRIMIGRRWPRFRRDGQGVDRQDVAALSSFRRYRQR